jgi:hypothetical protein
MLLVLFVLGSAAEVNGANKVVVIPLGDSVSADYEVEASFPAYSLRLIGAEFNSKGVVFAHDDNFGAALTVKRPLNWDGVSDITITLLVLGSVAGGETARFFARPRDFSDGDVDLDASTVNSNIISFSENGQYKEMTVVFPAASLPKDWWDIVIGRYQSDDSLYTNTTDISLLSVGLKYTATSQ